MFDFLSVQFETLNPSEAPSGRGFTIFHGHLCDLGLAKLNSLHGGPQVAPTCSSVPSHPFL